MDSVADRYLRNAVQCLGSFVAANPKWREIIPPAAHQLDAACKFAELAAACGATALPIEEIQRNVSDQ